MDSRSGVFTQNCDVRNSEVDINQESKLTQLVESNLILGEGKNGCGKG